MLGQPSISESQTSKEITEKTLRWKSHPLIENTARTITLFALLGVVLWAVYFAFDSVYYLCLAAIVLFFSLLRYFVPTHYQADSRGIHILFFGISKFREWSSFSNFYLHSTGVHLAPFERPSALDSFRGMFILFGRGDKDEIVEFLKRNIQRMEGKGMQANPEQTTNA